MYLAVLGVELLQRCEHKHGCLPHPRLGLADDVHPEDRLRDALVLDCRGTKGCEKVLETNKLGVEMVPKGARGVRNGETKMSG
jgi:hypothetical protein